MERRDVTLGRDDPVCRENVRWFVIVQVDWDTERGCGGGEGRRRRCDGGSRSTRGRGFGFQSNR